ncbi:MAG TPA: DinB family protein [Steroidobacteraceae bacterium]
MDKFTLTALASFPGQLAACYAALPADHANWSPDSWQGIPSEAFTPLGQVCHVRDIEIDGYHVRIQRILNESHPVFATIDGETLGRERGYSKASATEALSAFRTARIHTMALLSRLTPQQFARTGVLEGYGPLTLRSLAHYLCSHDQQHLAGLQWLLGKIEASLARTSRPLAA